MSGSLVKLAGWSLWDLARRIVRLDAEHVVEHAALVGRELILVAGGVEHGGPLIEWDGTEIAKGIGHHCAAVWRQHGHAACGVVDLHALLWRKALKHLGTGEAAVPLVDGELINAMELLEETLLVGGRQTGEVGIVAEGAFLLLDGLAAMLVEPVAEVTGRGGVGAVVGADLCT